MHALPILLATVIAALIAPALLQGLRAHSRPNYRGRRLPVPFGVLVPAAALLALIPLVLIARLGSTAIFHPELAPILIYCLGVIALGLIDDTLGERSTPASAGVSPVPRGERPGAPESAGASPAPRGWRGHSAAVLRGELSTGALKAAGSLGLALLAMDQLGLSDGRWLLATGVLVLATNAFNLLDLRPGRAVKVFALLGAGLTVGAGPRVLWSLGLLAGPALVAGGYDLREKAMLGDTGSNLLGALAGLWLVLTLSGTGQLIALAALLAVTVYGELRSISALVERTPGMRQLDSWGRPS
jgi:UDP-N-acetylmuramyl pentapeptide phosphotransferase/UDP-N-acetylglucosamine-1-phosphate transferase